MPLKTKKNLELVNVTGVTEPKSKFSTNYIGAKKH